MGRKRRLADMSGDPPPDTLLGMPPVKSLDLHGLPADDAERRTRDFIITCARSVSGEVVKIITGKGRRSPGQPVLMPLVRQLLEGELARHVAEFTVDVDGGSYVVRMR